jgi:16S rRNA U516 pseudouridylate synthase RsuA-like enzyme
VPRIVVPEGGERKVRASAEAGVYRVTARQRVGFGPLRLERLPEGEFRRLTPAEVERLRKAAGAI